MLYAFVAMTFMVVLFQEISPAVSAFLASPETTVNQMLLDKCADKVIINIINITITIIFILIFIIIK